MKTSLTMVLMTLIVATTAIASEWVETITMKGDLRYRHEMIDKDGSEIRNRQRIRTRISITAQPEDNLKLGLRLASGSDDPASGNQTLDGAFTTKSFMLDRAYFAWDHVASGTTIFGGKMGNPFYQPAKTELLWDGDLSPEGMALQHTFTQDNTRITINGASLWIDERKADDDVMMYGAQGLLAHTIDDMTFTVGGSYFDYTNLQGVVLNDHFFGNTNDGDTFMNDFTLVEFFAEIGFVVAERPITLFADFVINQNADTDNQGYLFGAKLGIAQKPGTWQLKYNYREVQKDAVMGALTDSDFRGSGTDGKGHELEFGYQLTGKSTLALTYFANKLGVENGTDYNRVMADLKFKF